MVAPDFLGHGRSDKPMGDYSLGSFASSMRDLLQMLDIIGSPWSASRSGAVWPCSSDPGGQTVNAMDRLYLAERTPTLIVWGERQDHSPVPCTTGARSNTQQPVGGTPRCRPFSSGRGPRQFVEVLKDFLCSAEPGEFAPQETRERRHRGRPGPDQNSHRS